MRAAGPSVLFLACAVTMTACEGKAREQPSKPAEQSQKAKKIPAADCLTGDAIDARTRRDLQGHAERLLNAIRGGAFDPVWADLHPEIRNPSRKTGFYQALSNMRTRLSVAEDAQPKLQDLRLIEIAPGVDETLKIRCGAETIDEQDDLVLVSNVEGDDLAWISLELPGDPIGQGLALKLRAHGDSWHLVELSVHPTSYRGKDAAAYEQIAGRLAAEDRVVAAYLAYGVAQSLLGRSTDVTLPATTRIEDELETLGKNEQFRAQTDEWTVDGTEFPVVRLGLRSSQGRLSPTMSYVTEHELADESAIKAEATQLARHFQDRFPKAAGLFESVMLEAYEEMPSEAGQAYDASQVLIFLDADDGEITPAPPDAP